MSNRISEDCSSGLHDYCSPCECNCHDFTITKQEARALNFFLRLHNGLMKESPEEYEQILRLINGLGNFIDSQSSDK